MDHREYRHKWYADFDERSMTLTVDFDDSIEEIPARYEVCDTCEGKGKVVNPAVDSHGISAEEFAEDPDFAVSYVSGLYDIACPQCRGARVSPEPDYEAMSKELGDKVANYITDYYQAQREEHYERRMGY